MGRKDFIELLDAAFNVYDKENFEIIDDLNNQISNLEANIRSLEEAIRYNNERRDYYNGEINKLNHPHSECSYHRREIKRMEDERRAYDERLRNASNRWSYYYSMQQEMYGMVRDLITEYHKHIFHRS
jgi:chromosome segregation ATPase